MLETGLWIGICAIIIASNTAMLTLLTKLYMRVGENSRDIKFIKSMIHINTRNCGPNEPQEDE